MKLRAIIKRFFMNDKFCFPTDFYWADRNTVKENIPNRAKRFILMVSFYCMATFYCCLYYMTIPFRILNEWCESWCYF